MTVGDKVWLFRGGREAVGTIERLGSNRNGVVRLYLRIPGEHVARTKDGTLGVWAHQVHLAEKGAA